MIHVGFKQFFERYGTTPDDLVDYVNQDLLPEIHGPGDLEKASAAYLFVAIACGRRPVDSLLEPLGGDWLRYWKAVYGYCVAICDGTGEPIAPSAFHHAALVEAFAISLILEGAVVEAS
jgi:hypothetical protein